MPAFEMQVNYPDNSNPPKRTWASVRCTGAEAPYRYKTREDAEYSLRMCYGDAVSREDLRVIEVEHEPNMS